MTGKALIAALGTDRKTLNKWLADGLPCTRKARGRPDFDAAAVRQWLIARGLAQEVRTAKTRDEVAQYFGVGLRTVAGWLAAGCPGAAGAYNLHEIHAWRDAQRNTKTDQADPLLAGSASPALEKYRQERAKLARLDRLERERSLLPREEVHELLGQIARVIRAAGQSLQRTYGLEAQNTLDEALDEADRLIDTLAARENGNPHS